MTPEERQKEHAANLSAERHLMRGLGVTREQARTRLHERAVEMRQEEAKRVQAQPPAPPPPPPTITTDITKFDPKPLTLGVAAGLSSGAGGGGKGGSPLGTIPNVIIVDLDTGIGSYYDLNGVYVGDV